ncbi:b6671258-603a-4148-9d73-97d91f520f2e [Thermothielavioides terrestris]|uniref:B6671258-603a-4148-9d73-97d91f520f2e n=1 Tax=Thermothielavioides terrestris TaxID=2587410 RepID=A0A446BNB5_9PEZI|nr:b6671258-603a-4148-9d73-97d91f520f2e [Thermothielavioides terrestris]
MAAERVRFRSTPRQPSEPGTINCEELRQTLDHNFAVIQLEFHRVLSGIQQLEKIAERTSQEFTQRLDKLLEQCGQPGISERKQAAHDAEVAALESEHRLQMESLQREMAKDKETLASMERHLRLSQMHAQMLEKEIQEAEREADTQSRRTGEPQEYLDPDEAIRSAFLGLRESILGFAGSSALQLGKLPNTAVGADELFHPRTWNRASGQQRRWRVMAKIFHLLFRRILRPGLRMFGLQAFLRSDEHHSISASEAHLRALEKELAARGVDRSLLENWIASTIDITSPLRDIPGNIEGITNEIFEALKPVVRFTFHRNADKVRGQISAICEQAVQLKLAIRRAPYIYKIEVPSRDVKKWGEPGCDQETRSLGPKAWLSVVDHEREPDEMDETADAPPRRAAGDISCVPFGALTKLETGEDGEKKKVILEKAWVISREPGGGLKRKATAPADEGEEQPKKRVSPNRGISPAHLARIKALMGGG